MISSLLISNNLHNLVGRLVWPLLFIVVAFLLVRHLKKAVPTSPYKFLRKRLLTANEKDFYSKLRAAVPEFPVLAQVSMGALMEGRHASGKHLQARAKFAQKIVDFVVLDSQYEVIVLIELDDRTHSVDRDSRRDAMTREAGYATLRIESQNKPTPAVLRKLILGHAS